MTRRFAHAAAVFGVIAAVHWVADARAPAPVGYAYVAATTQSSVGSLEMFSIRPDGLIFPTGLKSLYYLPSLSTWRVEAPIHVPTVDLAGAVSVTPDGRFLYVGGCIGKDRAISSYAISGKKPIPRKLGSPLLDGLCPSSYAVYQSLVVAGHYLFEVGDLTYGNGDASQIHRSIESFRIGTDGSLTKAGEAQIAGAGIVESYLAADPAGHSVFIAGGDRLRTYAVDANGSLSLSSSLPFPSPGIFSGLAYDPAHSSLYASYATAGSTTDLYAYHCAANGTVTSLPNSPRATSLNETLQSNQAMLTLQPHGSTLYLAAGKPIDAFSLNSDGSLGDARTYSHLLVTDPRAFQFGPGGHVLYDFDAHAGFLGGPAIVELAVARDGALSQLKVRYGGAPDEYTFIGRIPGDYGPAAIVP